MEDVLKLYVRKRLRLRMLVICIKITRFQYTKSGFTIHLFFFGKPFKRLAHGRHGVRKNLFLFDVFPCNGLYFAREKANKENTCASCSAPYSFAATLWGA